MHVFLIAAISADGFISPEVSTTSTVWTSAGDKQFFGDRTKQAKVVVMGRTTFETIGRPMKGRKIIVLSSQPKPEKYQSISEEDVLYTAETPQGVLESLKEQGFAEVAICGGSQIYAAFMEAQLIDSIYLTVEPVVFGKGISLFNKPLDQIRLTLKEMKKIDEHTVLLEYVVQKNGDTNV